MTEIFRVAAKGQNCLIGGEDVTCVADVPATDVIELRPIMQGVIPKSGAHVACYLDIIGLVDGVVLCGSPDGFALQVVANPERRSRIEARLAWLRGAETRNDRRKVARIVPLHRAVHIRLQCSEAAETLIVDLSMTGAALFQDERPVVGAVVTVGKRHATVVRHIAEGIGVAFRMPFGPLTFNERVII